MTGFHARIRYPIDPPSQVSCTGNAFGQNPGGLHLDAIQHESLNSDHCSSHETSRLDPAATNSRLGLGTLALYCLETSGIKNCFKLFCLDVIRDVLDSFNVRDAPKDITFELPIQVRIRIITGMRNGYLSVASFYALGLRSQEIPFANRKPHDLDSTLEMLPVTGDLTPSILFFRV